MNTRHVLLLLHSQKQNVCHMSHYNIKHAVLTMIAVMTIVACRHNNEDVAVKTHIFTIETLNGHTPVKDQGHGGTCWIHAMLAAIETDRIMKGDSVNLSPAFSMRCMLEEQYLRNVLCQGRSKVTDRGTAPDLLRLLAYYGTMPYDSYYHTATDDGRLTSSSLLARKTHALAEKAVAQRVSPMKYKPLLETMLDESLGTLPHRIYMLGAEYTPMEFGHSVCLRDNYVALTSFTHHPFNTYVDLELPDNHHHNLFYNIPIERLVAMVKKAVESGHGICWEGDISEKGFSFAKGLAICKAHKGNVQEQRQKDFFTASTTDDHCMAIVGLAHDGNGRQYYIMKNSWGKDNPYGGLMYMSEEYLKLKTVAVVMHKECIEELSAEEQKKGR